MWIGNNPKNTITRLDPKTNKVVVTIPVGHVPCSGLAGGFGSVWVPNCEDKTLSRVDIATNKVVATIPLGPANTEGAIAASEDSIWYLTDPKGVLSRIDPATNQAVAEILVPAGSFSAAYGEGAVWVTSTEGSVLTRVDPKTNLVDVATIQKGRSKAPLPCTVGEGAVWTLESRGTAQRSQESFRPRTIWWRALRREFQGQAVISPRAKAPMWVTMDQVPLHADRRKTPTMGRAAMDWTRRRLPPRWVGFGLGDQPRSASGVAG